MRCKPGDLAVIVRSRDSRNVGKLVHVLRPYERRDASWWVCSQSVLHGVFSDWPPGAEVVMFDSHLRPLRDPGEDAQDETLQWAPSPEMEWVTA